MLIFTPFIKREILVSLEICAFIILCVHLYLHIGMCVCELSLCWGHGECALLPPRVYLQTVILKQCNDYFYSRYFSSPFALSGMTPYWPTDYLCGCCHTWLLQLSTLSSIYTFSPSLFYYYTSIISSSFSSVALYTTPLPPLKSPDIVTWTCPLHGLCSTIITFLLPLNMKRAHASVTCGSRTGRCPHKNTYRSNINLHSTTHRFLFFSFPFPCDFLFGYIDILLKDKHSKTCNL